MPIWVQIASKRFIYWRKKQTRQGDPLDSNTHLTFLEVKRQGRRIGCEESWTVAQFQEWFSQVNVESLNQSHQLEQSDILPAWPALAPLPGVVIHQSSLREVQPSWIQDSSQGHQSTELTPAGGLSGLWDHMAWLPHVRITHSSEKCFSKTALVF